MFKRNRGSAGIRDASSDSDSLRDPVVQRLDDAVQYHGAIAEVLGRVAAAPGTVQAKRLDALIVAVEDYEARHGHEIAEGDKLSVRIRHLRSTRGIDR